MCEQCLGFESFNSCAGQCFLDLSFRSFVKPSTLVSLRLPFLDLADTRVRPSLDLEDILQSDYYILEAHGLFRPAKQTKRLHENFDLYMSITKILRPTVVMKKNRR